LLGAKVTEIPVTHKHRLHGKSNYGLERVFKVLFDLMVLWFISGYFAKPMYLFGSFGLFSLFASIFTFAWMIYLKVFEGLSMIQTPLPVLSGISFLLGIMSILMGLIAEMLVRTYYESQRLPPYFVIQSVNAQERAE
jgi:dolichol-phosphate mannosyltransferase